MVFQEVFQWPRQNYGPGTQTSQTGDATLTDRGRFYPRPGTVFGILYLLASQVPDKTSDRGRYDGGPETENLRTRDGTVLDRGRKTYGPGTVRCWTGDGKPTDQGRYGVGPETENLRTRDGTVLDRGRKTYGPDTKRPRPRDTKQPRDTEQPKEFCYSLAKNFQWNRIK